MLSIRVVLFLTLIYFLGLRIAHLNYLTKLLAGLQPERWTSFTFLTTLMFTATRTRLFGSVVSRCVIKSNRITRLKRSKIHDPKLEFDFFISLFPNQVIYLSSLIHNITDLVSHAASVTALGRTAK